MAQPQRESTRKILAAEALAQSVIGQAVDRAVTHARTLGLAPSHATLLVQASAALAIAKSRETAAQTSALQFEKQTGLDAEAPDDDAEGHAQRAANGLAKAFHEEMQSQFVAGLTTTAAYVATAKSLSPRGRQQYADPRSERDPVKEAPADPGLEIPSGWPRYGTLRGKRIDLRVDAPKMRPTDLADVIVNLPWLGKSHPWRGSDYAIAEDGSIIF